MNMCAFIIMHTFADFTRKSSSTTLSYVNPIASAINLSSSFIHGIALKYEI